MTIQSIIFDKKKYSKAKAIYYLKMKGHKYNKIDETQNYYRFRQVTPMTAVKTNVIGVKYMTLDMKPGIKYIVYYKSSKK